jgi:uncharacterized membrane protein
MGQTKKRYLIKNGQELIDMYHWGYFPPFGMVFFLFVIGLCLVNIAIWRSRSGMYYRYSQHAQVILDKRLATGEIDLDEYEKIKGILQK